MVKYCGCVAAGHIVAKCNGARNETKPKVDIPWMTAQAGVKAQDAMYGQGMPTHELCTRAFWQSRWLQMHVCIGCMGAKMKYAVAYIDEMGMWRISYFTDARNAHSLFAAKKKAKIHVFLDHLIGSK